MIFGQVACDATTALLLSMQPGTVKFKNVGPNTVWIGEAGVAITTGYQLKIDEEIEIVARYDAVFHAVCDTAETAVVDYVIY